MAICKAALLNLHMNLKIQIKISIYEFSMLEKDIKLYLETTIMKHQYPRFEFVIENTWEAFGGSLHLKMFSIQSHMNFLAQQPRTAKGRRNFCNAMALAKSFRQ